jgi:hypothetical protein
MFTERDPKHVMIAVATRGEIRWETSAALLQLVTQPSPDGHGFSIVPGGGCDVCHARNLLMHHFLTRTDASRLLFLDADVVPSAQNFFDLLAHPFPFVAGRYPRRDTKLVWSYNGPVEHGSGLLDCFEVCTGFLALSYELVKTLSDTSPRFTVDDRAYLGESAAEVMRMAVWDARRYSEDFYLSRRVRELGIPLLVDPRIEVGHMATVNLLNVLRKD